MIVSTHVLDTMRGAPAPGVAVKLQRREPDGEWKEVAHGVTDADGRIRTLGDEDATEGDYRLDFETRTYFERSGLTVFYPEVSVVFNVEDVSAQLHVPLLLSAYGYTTYRGS